MRGALGGPKREDMRRFELSTRIPAPASEAWSTPSALDRWSEWSTLVTCESGRLDPGSTLELSVRDSDGRATPFQPSVVSVMPPHTAVLAATVGRLGLLCMVHTFCLKPAGESPCDLRQSWTATGPLTYLAWALVRSRMARYERLDANLAALLASD